MNINTNIYRYITYIVVIEKQIAFNKKVYGYKTKLAEAAGCQRSFFSQVLKGDVDLTPEQGLGLARFWQLDEVQSEYFLNLLLYARAGTKTLKDFYFERIERTRSEQNKLSQRIGPVPQLPEQLAAKFFGNWHFMAINILLSIPQVRTSAKIADRLALPLPMTEKALREMTEWGLITQHGNEWRTTNAVIHQPRDSIFSALNHSHWRKRATDDAFAGVDDSIHYTSVCTLSRADVERIRNLVLDLIKEQREIVGPSPEEDLYCLTCDWFRV